MMHAEPRLARMRLLVVLAVVSLAGCARPGQSESVQPPLACLATFAGEPGANAVLLAALQDDPEALAGRIAGVAGDNVSGPPSDENGTLRFPTQRGHVDYLRAGTADGGRFSVSWTGAPTWGNESETEIAQRLLLALEFPGAARAADLGEGHAFVQTLDGEAIVGTGGVVRAVGFLRVSALYEVRPPDPRLNDTRVAEIATEFAECELGEGATVERAGWLVRRDSLAHAFSIAREGECGAIAIDAETGAVHEAARVDC